MQRSTPWITAKTLGVASLLGCTVGLIAAVAIGSYIESNQEWSYAVWLPAGLCGLFAFAVAMWRAYEGEPPQSIAESLKDAWKSSDDL